MVHWLYTHPEGVADSHSTHTVELGTVCKLETWLQHWGTVAADVNVRCVESPELTNVPLKPGVGRSTATHASHCV